MTNEPDLESARRTAASIYETLRVFELEAEVLLARYGYGPTSVATTRSVLGDLVSTAMQGAGSILRVGAGRKGSLGSELEAIVSELTRLGSTGNSQINARQRLEGEGERLDSSLSDLKFRLTSAVRVNAAIDKRMGALSSALDRGEGGLVRSVPLPQNEQNEQDE